MVVSHFVYLSK